MRKTFHILTLLFLFCLSATQAHAQKKKKDQVSYKDKLKFERLYIDASKAKMLSDLDQAAKLYEACKKIDPSQAAPYFELGNIYMHIGELEEAIENSREAASIDRENFYYRLLYAEILKNSQQYTAAREEFESIMNDFPQKVNPYLEVAVLYMMKKEYSSAVETYDKLEEQIGPNEEVKLKKQYLYIQMGEVDKAANEVKALIELFPDNLQYYLLLAEIYHVNGKDDKALKEYKKAADKFPNDATVHLSMAEFYRSQESFEKALGHLKIAYASRELDVDEKVKTILSYFDLADRDRAYARDLIELGEILYKTHGNEARVLTINGDLQLNYGEKEKARTYFSKAVLVDPSRFPIWSQLMILEAELQMNDSLAMHAEMAMEYFPNQPASYYFLGIAKSQLNEHEEAAEAYRQGLNLILDNPPLQVQFYLGMGDSYNKIEKHELSDEAFEKALAIDSNNTIALNNFSYYLSLRGEKLEQALKMSAKANKLEPNSATYLDTYAWILYQLEKYEEAKIWMEKALKYGGDSSGEVLEHMGDIYWKLGEEKKALDYFEKAQSLADSSDDLPAKIKTLKNKNIED